MAKLGVHVYEKATSVQTPKVATVGIPFVVGTAPVQSAAKPAKSNVPVLVTSWDEAVEKLGFSYDWESYTLCEFMYSHLQLFGAQPVIFCNINDPASMKREEAAADYTVADHRVAVSVDAIADTIKVSVAEGAGEAATTRALERDTDYSILYDRDDTDTYVCIVELLDGGEHYDAAELYIKYGIVKPEAVAKTDIVEAWASLTTA